MVQVLSEIRTVANSEATLDATKYVQGANQVDRANEQMARGQQEVARTTETTERRLTENTGALERLRRGIDEAHGRQVQFERGQATLNRALEQSRISGAEHARLMELLRARYQGTTEAAEAAGGRTRNFGQIIGQAGFQVQDFASQVAGGQSVLVAFAQQGSQLLGVFGVAGAIAGAILTVGVLAAQLLGVGNSAKEAEKATKDYEEALKRLQSLSDTTAEAARRRIESDREEARAVYEKVRARNMEANSRAAANALSASIEVSDLRQLVDDGRAVERSSGVRSPVLPEFERRLAAAEARLAKFREEAEQTAGAARQAAVDFERALTREDRQATQSAREAVRRDIRDLVDDDFEAAIEAERRRNEEIERSIRLERERNQAIGASLATSLQTPEERARAAIGQAGALRGSGAISQETYERAVARANQELARQSPLLREIERTADRTFETVGSAITQAFVTGEGGALRFRNVAIGVLSEIGQAALRMAVISPVTRALTSAIGSAFGGAIGGVGGYDAVGTPVNTSSAFGGPRADGGPVDPSKWYVVGERGPEIFVPDAAGTIVPNGVGGGTTVTINIAAGVTRQELFALLPVIEARVKQSVADGRQRGGRFASAMGS